VRIVLLNDKRQERDAMLRALSQATHQVEAVPDESAALAAIARDAPQLILFSLPAKGAPDLTRRLRGADASGNAYLLALLESSATGKEVSAVAEAGVHDFMRRANWEAEMLERVKAPTRLLHWAHSLKKPAAFDFSAGTDIRSLQVWKCLGGHVAEDLWQMVGQSVDVEEGWPARFASSVRSATIQMSLASEQLEVRLTVAADDVTVDWIRSALLGDPNASNDAVDDALRELTNTAGGAIKRAALAENVAFTIGLPKTNATAPAREGAATWRLTIEGGSGCLAVVAEIRSLGNQRVQASKLAEGMVIAHDVRNESGILLVPAGARLTATSAARLAKMLGSTFLEVAPAA